MSKSFNEIIPESLKIELLSSLPEIDQSEVEPKEDYNAENVSLENLESKILILSEIKAEVIINEMKKKLKIEQMQPESQYE
ncbi:MAG: hypothetical protein ACD_59C00077G0010 [uncultured bacterium]|nr:MAG: hypothetical protein ACD_59C00077G0010 [uncultured bacterium]